MDKFVIQGGVPLEGEIEVSGAKNSALPVLAACLLTADRVTIDRIPPVRDIATMQKLMKHIGAQVTVKEGRVTVEASEIEHPEAPYELVKTMRASSLVLGPLLARCGRARVSLPGGCAIGRGRSISTWQDWSDWERKSDRSTDTLKRKLRMVSRERATHSIASA